MTEANREKIKILRSLSDALASYLKYHQSNNNIVLECRPIKCLVAVSGGLDSVVLLHGLAELNNLLEYQGHLAESTDSNPEVAKLLDPIKEIAKVKLEIHVAHVNHKVRESADFDQQFVINCCKQLGVPIYCRDLAQCPTGENFEKWAREERYSFFNHCLQEHQLDLIMTAHHQDDLVETFLMRLISNKELRAIQQISRNGHLVRPLLTLKKSELVNYALEYRVAYREDETNYDNSYLRNSIRNLLIPYLTQHYGSVAVDSIASEALKIDQVYYTLDKEAEKIAKDLINNYPFVSKEFNRALKTTLNSKPEIIGDLVVRSIFKPLSATPIGSFSASRLRKFISNGSETAIELPGGLTVRRSKGSLIAYSRYKGQ